MSDYKTEVLALSPVGYWRLGEAAGTNAVDEVLTNDGTYVNTPTLGVTSLLTADTDTAVTFLRTGSEDVNMGDVLARTKDDPFTLCAWINTSDTTNSQGVLGKYLAASNRGFAMYVSTGKIIAIIVNTYSTNGIRKASDDTVADGSIHFVCMTYDGSATAAGTKLYIDGVEAGTTTDFDNLSSTITSAAPFSVGSFNGTANYFDGEIDEPAIFNTELTAKNIARLYHTGKGVLDRYPQDVMGLIPVSYWRLGESVGTNAVDETGNNDGTYINTPTLGVTGMISEDTDTAVTFDGVNEEVTMGDVLDFDKTDPFSAAAWVNTTSTSVVVVAKVTGTFSAGWMLNVLTGGKLAFYMIADWSTVNYLKVSVTTVNISDGADHFIAVTYDGSATAAGVTIYIDGVSVAVTVDQDTLSVSTLTAATFSIGSRSDEGVNWWNGELDEVAIFAHELSAAEALFLYDSGVYVTPDATPAFLNQDYRNTVLALRPLAYWRLGEASGTNAVDEMLRNDGTYVNTPTLGATGLLTDDDDTAATFVSASSEYVDMGDVLAFTHNIPFSFCLWVNTTDDDGVLFSKYDGTALKGFTLHNGATTVAFIWRTVQNTNEMKIFYNDADHLWDGNTHFVLVTYDGSTNASGVTFYIDGVIQVPTVSIDNLSSSPVTSVSLNLAAQKDGAGLLLDGTLDEVAIFGSELTAKDGAAMYYKGLGKIGYEYEVLALAPAGYWRLGEDSGTNAVDEMGNNDGTYVNTPTLGATALVPAEDTDTAVTFLASASEYVGMGNVHDFTNNSVFSLSCWFSTTFGTSQGLMSKMTSFQDGYSIYMGTTGKVGFYRTKAWSTNDASISTVAAFNDGNPHHVVCTCAGGNDVSNMKIYVDGVLQPVDILYNNLSSSITNSNSFNIAGLDDGAYNPFDGTLDEAAIFYHELTAADASRLYIAGLALYHGLGYSNVVLQLAPIGYWRLGESSGTNAADELGNYDGTYTNTPTLAQTGALTDDLDTAVLFTAANDEYVTMGDVLDFERTDTFTLAAWFKTTEAGNATILSKQAFASPYEGYRISCIGGKISLWLINDAAGSNFINVRTTSTSFNDGNWHSVVATYDGSSNASGVTIYVDGVLEAVTEDTDTLSATTLSAIPLQIGGRDSQTDFMDGTIDEVAIFDYELTAAHAARMYWAGKGHRRYALAAITEAVGYWRLGEDSGTDAIDEIGTNDGTYTNTPTLGVTGGVPNDDDTAVLFTAASSEDVAVADVLDFDYDVPCSFATWFKTTGTSEQAMISKMLGAGGNYAGYDIRVTTAGAIKISIQNEAGANQMHVSTTATTFNDGNWHFAVVTVDGSSAGSGVAIYIDGVAVAVTVDADTLTATTVTAAALHFAARQDATIYFDGSMDDTAIYDVELTANEVADTYIAGLLSYTEEVTGGAGGTYEEAVSDTPSIGGVVGATADHSLTEATQLVTVLATHWGKSVTESFNWEVGVGIITTLTDSFNATASAATVRNLIGSVIESIQFALTENIEHAKGVLESLALNEVWAANTILQGALEDTLNVAEVIRLTWDQLQTETVSITDTDSAYAQKGAALAELFVSAGIVDTIHRAAGIIAEAMILQDLVERYFELSATDSVTMSDTDVAMYRAVAENIEAAVMADVLSGTRRLSLLISDEVAGSDTTAIAQRLRAALEDNAIFGGTIVLPDGVFSAIVLNTESLGISEYTNYPFNSFGKLGNDYLGASDTDIFQLTGDDDDGTDIDAVIRTSMTNFGTNVFKRVPRAYLGYTSDGGMIMKTISTSGGVKTERWYELTPRTADAHAAARIQLGRGVKATYWQFELINKLGADFDIDSLQLYPMILKRRV